MSEPNTPLPACVWCGASRAEQGVGQSFYTADGDPLCAVCWDEEYGEDARESAVMDTRWKAAYCAEFRRFATERGWSQDAIESGWLDDTPDNALIHYGRRSDPAECARRDVPECEEPADAE